MANLFGGVGTKSIKQAAKPEVKSVKSVAAVAVMKVKAGLDVGWMGPLGGSNLFHGLQLQTRVTNLESCSPSKDQEMTILIPICDLSFFPSTPLHQHGQCPLD